jgi:hypothetical protein
MLWKITWNLIATSRYNGRVGPIYYYLNVSSIIPVWNYKDIRVRSIQDISDPVPKCPRDTSIGIGSEVSDRRFGTAYGTELSVKGPKYPVTIKQ